MQEEKQKVFGLVTRFYGEPGWKQISRFFSSSEYPLRDMADLKKRLITIMVCQLELAKPENWSKYFKLDEPKTAFIFEQDYKQLIRFWLVSHIDPDINNIEQSLDSLTFLKEVPLLEIMEIKSSGKAGILKQWCSNKLQLYRDNLLSIVRNISPGDGNFNKAATIYEFIFWAERIPLYSDNWNSKPNELFQKALNFFFEHVKNLSDGQQARFIIRILTIFYGIRIDEKYLGVNAIKSICEIFISKSQQFNERGLAESGIAERITTSESVDYSLCQYLLKRLRAKEETEDESEEAEIIREIISEISLRKTAYQDILTNKFDNWDCKCILDFLKKHLDLYEDDAIKKFFSGFDAYLESRINADKPDAIFYRYKILGAEKNLAEAKNLLLQKENIFLNISLEQKNLPKNSLAEIFRDLIDHYQGLPDVPDAQEKSRSACRKMLQLLFNGEPQFFDYFGKYDLIDGFIDFLTKENIVESRDIWYRAKEFLSDQLIERKEFEKILGLV